jgi:hypothetical protein
MKLRRIRDHLLIGPLKTPIPDVYSSDPEALRSASNLYDQLIDKGYTDEDAARLARVARVVDHHYQEPADG